MAVTVEIQDQQVKDLLKGLQKDYKKVTDKDRSYVTLLGAIVFRNVIEHFQRQEGPDGRWRAWSDKYRAHMLKIGRGGNLILQDSGRLKGGWLPTRYQLSSEGILWYNPVTYARKHDEGIGVPKREFAWISENATTEMVDQTHRFLGFK